ncbi:Sulfotransferase 1C4 [Amphibalanus amphitrite]|uniref:Sulfotransferase 1C4 n=1 Tax=Amphibalanus amphitrite TaxID=1232801 RepID=A0A6A4WUR7_AMPAM|nr:Sulfotransferase 1C4 [Amphibalanus amphitrite]
MSTLHPPDEWETLPADATYEKALLRHCRYRNTVLTNLHLEFGCPQHWAQFVGRPTDVVVASFPQSGGSWLQELVWRLVTGGQSSAGSGASAVPQQHRFPLLDAPPENTFMATVPLEEVADPRMIRTHLPYHLLPSGVLSSGAKLLYVSRDPRDVCVSYYHFSRRFGPHLYSGSFAEFRDSFTRGEVTYGPYREHVRGYQRHAATVLCVTYGQLQTERAAVVRRVAEFLERPVTDRQVDQIVRQTSTDVMRADPGSNYHHWEQAGTVAGGGDAFEQEDAAGNWRKYFTEEESEAFLKWAREEVALPS